MSVKEKSTYITSDGTIFDTLRGAELEESRIQIVKSIHDHGRPRRDHDVPLDAEIVEDFLGLFNFPGGHIDVPSLCDQIVDYLIDVKLKFEPVEVPENPTLVSHQDTVTIGGHTYVVDEVKKALERARGYPSSIQNQSVDSLINIVDRCIQNMEAS